MNLELDLNKLNCVLQCNKDVYPKIDIKQLYV